MELSTLTIDLPETYREAVRTQDGVPFVTKAIVCKYNIADNYLLIEGMAGINDRDVNDIMKSVATGADAAAAEIASGLLRMCDGYLVDMRAPGLPGTSRLYAD